MPYAFTEQGSHPSFQADEGLHCDGKQAIARKRRNCSNFVDPSSFKYFLILTGSVYPKMPATRSRPSCSWRISLCIAHCSRSCERRNKGAPPYTLKGAFSNYVYASGCWPSCAFHAHSVTCISVNRAVKLEFSGLHAYMPNRIFPAPSSMWQIRI